MATPRIDPAHVRGWGIDADPENDPTYPMKQRSDRDHAGATWERPPQQPVDIEVLHSSERPTVTAVFGTSAPPAGLSGAIRRLAFRYSESSFGHWLPLMLADRVNAVEGLVDDLRRGRVPHVPRERGWAAEWRHNRRGVAGRVLIGATLTVLAVAYRRRGRRGP
jgi:hypothetical protein